MKHYTSIEQSKKLLELGLNPESADFEYKCVGFTMHTTKPTDDFKYKVMLKEQNIPHEPKYNIPCWSLGALLEVMPKEIIDESGIDYKLLLDVKEGFPKYYSASYEIYHGDFPYPIRDEDKTLFEYIVEAVIWLLENNYIKPEKP